MSTPQLIEKINQLKASLEASSEFLKTFKKTAPRIEDIHLLISIAKNNGINITADELQTFFETMPSNNQELDDSLLEEIAGGRSIKMPSYLS